MKKKVKKAQGGDTLKPTMNNTQTLVQKKLKAKSIQWTPKQRTTYQKIDTTNKSTKRI